MINVTNDQMFLLTLKNKMLFGQSHSQMIWDSKIMNCAFGVIKAKGWHTKY